MRIPNSRGLRPVPQNEPKAKKFVKGVSVPDITAHHIALQRISSLNDDMRVVFSPGYQQSLDYVVSTLRHKPQVSEFNSPPWSESPPTVKTQPRHAGPEYAWQGTSIASSARARSAVVAARDVGVAAGSRDQDAGAQSEEPGRTGLAHLPDGEVRGHQHTEVVHGKLRTDRDECAHPEPRPRAQRAQSDQDQDDCECRFEEELRAVPTSPSSLASELNPS